MWSLIKNTISLIQIKRIRKNKNSIKNVGNYQNLLRLLASEDPIKRMKKLETKLPQEKFLNNSGQILNIKGIENLKEDCYFIEPRDLDGDAPKYFIKAYFYEKGKKGFKKNLDSWSSFIAKSAEKWYPHESVVEFMINRIGQTIGVRMNEVRLSMINGQIRFLSKFFIHRNEMLVHGAEICGDYLGDPKFANEIAISRVSARELFTFEFIGEAIQNLYSSCFEEILEDLVRMLTFDALVGNNDRHFYNWGIIDSALKSRKRPKFAPIYDSARGFVWNWSDDEIVRHWELRSKDGKKIDKYIDSAKPRISFESNLKANHFELIGYLKKKNAIYRDIILELASEKKEKMVLEMLKSEFFPYFIRERNEIIAFTVKTRFKKVREV